MFAFLMYLAGVIIGVMITRFLWLPKQVGNLRVDTSDPDGPYLFLELTKDLDSVIKKNSVVLKVRKENFISQE